MLIVGVNINVFVLAAAMVLYDVYAVFINMLQLKKYIHYGLLEQIRDLLPAFLLGAVMAVLVWVIPAFESLIITLAVKILIGAFILFLRLFLAAFGS